MNHKPTRPTVGPRGGRAVQATPCAECVSWRSCRPASISEPFGCESWADQDGRRALPDELEPDPEGGAAEYERDRVEAEADMERLRALPCEPCQGVPSECGPCGCPEVERDPYCPRCGQRHALHNGDGSCIVDEGESAMYPHDEEDGISSDHLELGAFESYNAAPFRPASPYAPDPSRGEGAAQGVLPMADAGPLFAGCPEVRR